MDAPDEIASVRAFQAAWGDDPLARSVLGSVDVIKTVTSEKIRKYHKTHYVPEDTVISVCGNTTYDEMAAKCQKYGIKAEPLDGTSVVVEKTPEFKPRKMAMERDSEQVYFTYCWPGPMISSEEIAECLVLMTILCGSISSRLFQRLREQEGLVYNIATLSSFSKSTGLLGIYGAVPKENFTRSRDILLFELDQFRKNGVSHDELERAKRMIKGSTKLSMESNTASMDRNGKLALLLGEVPGIDQVIGRVMDLKLNYINKYIGDTVPEDFAVSLVGKGIEGLEGFECE
jgi:predicted Zn-dependent peptidase